MPSRAAVILCLCFIAVQKCFAHPADVSQLRVRVDHDHVEFRFSINIATIARVVAIDSNQDNKVTFAEIAAAVPAMREALSKGVLVSINDEETSIGDFTKHECIWPNPEKSELTPQDAGQRYVDFNFTRPWTQGVEDVWLGFKVFERFGDLHVIQCIFQQRGEPDQPVDFSVQEPDYLYDTGWTKSTLSEPSPVVDLAKPKRLNWTLVIVVLLVVVGAVIYMTRRREA